MKKSQLKKLIRESIKQLMSEQPQQGNLKVSGGNLSLVPCNVPGGHLPTQWSYSFIGWSPISTNQPGTQTLNSPCIILNIPNGDPFPLYGDPAYDGSVGPGAAVTDTSGNVYRMYIGGIYSHSSCPNPQLTLTVHTSWTTNIVPDALPPGDPNGCNPNFSGPVIKCKKNETHPKFGGTCVEVLSDSPSTMPGNPGWYTIPNNPDFFDSMYDCKQSDCQQGLSPDSGGGKDPITPLTTTPQSKVVDPEVDRMQKIANIK